MSTRQQATTTETRCLECDAPIHRPPGKPGRAPLRCPLHRAARKRKVDQQSRRDAAIRRATKTPLPGTVACAECGKPIHWNRSKGGRPPERCPPCRAERRTSLKRLYKRGGKAPGPGYVARIDRPVPADEASGETGTVRTGRCVDCGATVSVTRRGGLPKRCPEHRDAHNAKLARERKAKADAKKPKPKPTPKAVKCRRTPPKAKERPGPTVSAKPVRATRSASKARRPAAKPAPGRATKAAAIRPRTRQPAPGEETRKRTATTNGAEANAQPVTRKPIAKTPPKPKPWQRRVRQINAELGTSMSAAEMIELGLKPFEDEWWG